MQTGTKVSAIGHGTLIALAAFGLPWFSPGEREPIRVTDVSFVSEAEFEAAQAAAPAEAPREEDAPAEQPAAVPAPTPEPEPEAPSDVAPEVSALEPPDAPDAPETPDRIVPKIVTLAPPTAATPPRARPALRVEPEPTPPPPDAVRPADLPKPVTAPAPEPEPEVAKVEETPAAPPEAAPEAAVEPAPPATLALQTSSPPMRRPKELPRDTAAESVMAALKQEVAKETARRKPAATPPTPPTPPSITEPTAAAPAATSLPVGPPLSNSEKDGLKMAVSRCWNVPAGVRDAQDLKVTLAAELGADGAVINASIRMIEPRAAPDPRFQQAFEAGRRALIRCSPYDLPRDKYAQWRNIEVVFNPEGMVSW